MRGLRRSADGRHAVTLIHPHTQQPSTKYPAPFASVVRDTLDSVKIPESQLARADWSWRHRGRVQCGPFLRAAAPSALFALEMRRPYDRKKRTEKDESDEWCGKFSYEERTYGSGAVALFILRSPCLLQRGPGNIRMVPGITDLPLCTQEAKERYLFRSHRRPMTKSDGLSLRRVDYLSLRG